MKRVKFIFKKTKLNSLFIVSLILLLFFCGGYFAIPVSFSADAIDVNEIDGRDNMDFGDIDENDKVGLVLSGGAAWGLAHVGVLEVIEEAGINVDMISGTSAGAIVGALYADGYSPSQLKELVSELGWTDFIFPSINSRGFFSSLRVEENLDELLESEDISDLEVFFNIAVTDMDKGELIEYSSGPLAKLLSASAAVPVMFSPVEYEDKLLADGGLIDNLPQNALRKAGADVIIAVDVAGNFSFTGRAEGMIEYGNRAFNIMRRTMQDVSGADILIQPELDGYSGIDFNNYVEIIEKGREAAMIHFEPAEKDN